MYLVVVILLLLLYTQKLYESKHYITKSNKKRLKSNTFFVSMKVLTLKKTHRNNLCG